MFCMWRSLCGLGLLILRNANRKSEMERYLFLDFDGVLNTEHYQNLLYYEGKALQDEYGWTMSAWHCSSWEWQTKWEKMPKKKEKGKIQERTVFRHLQTTKKYKEHAIVIPFLTALCALKTLFQKWLRGEKGGTLATLVQSVAVTAAVAYLSRPGRLSLRDFSPIWKDYSHPWERLFPLMGKSFPPHGKNSRAFGKIPRGDVVVEPDIPGTAEAHDFHPWYNSIQMIHISEWKDTKILMFFQTICQTFRILNVKTPNIIHHCTLSAPL